jgi:hypothetical protein
MATFEVHNKIVLQRKDVTEQELYQILTSNLSHHYSLSDIALTDTGLLVNGNLTDTFERAITKAEATLTIVGDVLCYRVRGTSSLGKWPWIFLVMGLFTGFFSASSSIWQLFFFSQGKNPRNISRMCFRQ